MLQPVRAFPITNCFAALVRIVRDYGTPSALYPWPIYLAISKMIDHVFQHPVCSRSVCRLGDRRAVYSRVFIVRV